MLSAEELRIKMGELLRYEDIFAEVERCVIAAADSGEHHIIYRWINKVSESQKNRLHHELTELGYQVRPVNEIQDHMERDSAIRISW